MQLHFNSRVPLLCECSEPRCAEFVLIDPAVYTRLRLYGFVVAPGHAADGALVERREKDYWVQSVTQPRPRQQLAT